jgi:hypothetical protein
MSNRIVVVVESLIIGTSVIILVLLSTSKSHQILVEDKINNNVNFIRQLTTILTKIMQRETNPEIKRELERFASKVKYSDPIGGNKLKDIEDAIICMADSLSTKENSSKLDVISEMRILLEERNLNCKMMK